MDHSETRTVILTLKSIVRSKRVRYRDIAAELKVSEQTVKRLFTSDDDVPLSRLERICGIIGITLADLMDSVRTARLEEYQLEEAQERLLASEPALFALYVLIHDGVAPQEIAKRHGLKWAAVFRALRKLEKAGMLEIGPRDSVRLKHRGAITWRLQGPLQKKYLLERDTRFVEGVLREVVHSGLREGNFVNSSWYPVSKETRKRFVDDFRVLVQDMHRMAQRDRRVLPESELVPVKWLVCLGDDPSAPGLLLRELR